MKQMKEESRVFELHLKRHLEQEELTCLRIKQMADSFPEFDGLLDPTDAANPTTLAYLVKKYYDAMDSIAEDRVREVIPVFSLVTLRSSK